MSKQSFLATRTHSLQALALDPRNDSAMTLLRRTRAWVTLAGLSESPVPEAATLVAAGPGGGSAILEYENREKTPETGPVAGGFTRHLELASQLDASGELEGALGHYLEARNALVQPDPELENRIVATKTALATRYYDEGVRLFRKNLAESIAAFEAALEHDPDHTKAQLYLASARRLAGGTQ